VEMDLDVWSKKEEKCGAAERRNSSHGPKLLLHQSSGAYPGMLLLAQFQIEDGTWVVLAKQPLVTMVAQHLVSCHHQYSLPLTAMIRQFLCLE
jgi:hypothetical protein